ncbi:MAG: hypothetical protein P4L69_14545 [Desulfosporosinus sp.]|nr:hypothetical protein [Desulfosporosinus sp.]
MGASYAKASNFVDSLIEVGTSVTVQAIADNKAHISQENVIVISGDCHIKVDVLHMENYARIDLKALASTMTSADFQTSIKETIEQKAKTDAKAAIGIAYADSMAVQHTVTRISNAVISSCSSFVNSDTIQKNMIGCSDHGSLDTRIIDMVNTVNEIQATISKSKTVTTAKSECVKEIDQETGATAKGWDITLMVVAIVVVVLVFTLGGVDIVAMNVVKPSTWLIVGLLVTFWGLWNLDKGYTHNTILPTDTEQEKQKKQSWHAKDKRIGWILTGIGAVVSLITGFIFVTQHKKTK